MRTTIAGGVMFLSGYVLADVATMTTDRVPEAIAAGESARDRDKLCFERVAVLRGEGGKVFLTGTIGTGYHVFVYTPFSTVAARAFDGKRKFEPLHPDSVALDKPEAQLVRVTIIPQGSGPIAGVDYIVQDVEAVVIRRGDEVVKPALSEPEEHAFANAYGGRQQIVKGGTFSFPLEVFDPEKGDLEIVIIPASSTATERWKVTMKAKDLERLR